MVNYAYKLEDIERNAERYETSGVVTASEQVAALLEEAGRERRSSAEEAGAVRGEK